MNHHHQAIRQQGLATALCQQFDGEVAQECPRRNFLSAGRALLCREIQKQRKMIHEPTLAIRFERSFYDKVKEDW